MRNELDNLANLLGGLAFILWMLLMLMPVFVSCTKRDNNVDTHSNKVCKTHVVTTVNKFTYDKCVEWEKE